MNRRAEILFLGSGAFAVPVLRALAADSRWQVTCAVTRPDARSGRGLACRESPVAAAASAIGIEVYRTSRLGASARRDLGGMRFDAAVSADFGLWIPRWLLALPSRGVVNVHPSRLPRYRGPSPVVWTILNGDDETAVTFMLTDEGWDTGPVLASVPHGVKPDDTSGMLEERLSEIASLNINTVLADYFEERIHPCPQSGEGVHAPVLPPSARWLDWSLPAHVLERRVRAFQPEPGALASFRGRRVEILKASAACLEGPPGRIGLAEGSMSVCCGSGSLELLEVRPESRRSMSGTAFAAGYRPRDGETMDAHN